MSLFPSSFDSVNSNERQSVNINLIDGVFVPLKDEKMVAPAGLAQVGSIRNEKGFDFEHILRIKQHTDDKTMKELNVKHLVLNDTIFARIFIGGTSIFGLYVLYNLLYRKNK